MARILGLRTKNGRNRARIHARGPLHAVPCTGLGTRSHAPRTRTGVRRTTYPGPAACGRARGAKYIGLTRHAHFPGSGVRGFSLAVTKSKSPARVQGFPLAVTKSKKPSLGSRFAVTKSPARVRRSTLAVTDSHKFLAGTRRSKFDVTRFTSGIYHRAIERGAKFLALRDLPSHVIDEISKAAKNSREKLEELYARCFQQMTLLYNI